MASTYSNIGIELIGNYEQEDTWGPTTNENFGYFDEAIDGVISLALTTTTETLTTPDGNSGDTLALGGRHKVVRFTGTPGGTCTVTVAPSDMQKVYMIYNNTDQSVIIKQGSAGSTVTVVSGSKVILYCDGGGATNGAVIETGYTHPTFNGDDINIATTALTGAYVFDDIDIVVTTDTDGHVTAASGAVSTRELTPANIGAQAAGTYNTIIGTDTDLNTSGAQVIDVITMTDGVIQNAITTRNLTAGDIGAQAAGTYNTIIGTDTDLNTSNAQVIDVISLTDGVINSAITTRNLTLADISAVGNLQYVNSVSNLTLTTTHVVYLSDSITITTGQVTILFISNLYAYETGSGYLEIYRGGTLVGESSAFYTTSTGGIKITASVFYTDNPGAGTYTYSVRAWAASSSLHLIYNGSLILMES